MINKEETLDLQGKRRIWGRAQGGDTTRTIEKSIILLPILTATYQNVFHELAWSDTVYPGVRGLQRHFDTGKGQIFSTKSEGRLNPLDNSSLMAAVS